MAMAALVLGSCGLKNTTEMSPSEPVIGKNEIKLDGDRLTAEALWAMGRIGQAEINEQTGLVVYSVTYYSVEQNKSNSELFLLNPADGTTVQLTNDNHYQGQAHWLSDDMIAYLSDESGSSQVWTMKICQNRAMKVNELKQITNYEKDIEDFMFSPDHSKLLFISQVKTVEQTVDKYPDLPKASGRIVTDLMYKHWDEWVESAPHPFLADFDGKGITNIVDILEGEPYECPMKPFGGMEQLAFSPDSKQIAYTCRKKTGLEYAISTNSDIYLYDICARTTKNLTDGMMGYDTNPAFSPDGTKLAWQSMARDGYESDQNRLMVLDLTTADAEPKFVSQAFESNVDEFLWLNNSRLAFTGCWHAVEHIYTVNLEGFVQEVSGGQFDYSLCGHQGDLILCKRHSMREPDDLYLLDLPSDELMPKQITFENKHILDQLTMGKVEERWMRTCDGQQMLTWIIYPPHFDPSKKYPTLLYCEGGPQSPVSQFWSYRWNFMMMSAHDYIIVAPNRRGLPGFGNEWNEEISGDYGGLCMKDYLTAIDEMCKEPYVDKDHLGCVGASFGGFSVYWLAGHHDKRFKAFIAHDGIFNLEMQYLETEEKWFVNWDLGGAPWDKGNAVAMRSYANSPHLFADKWDTPILCIHGEKDYRILANQAMAAFDAAKMRGVDAELLIFPDENHWVLKPQNGILWQRTFYEWLDKYLKVESK